MPVTKDRAGAYAPTSAILSLVHRHRDRGLPSPVNAEVLARAGVSDSLIPRTLQSLQALDLISEDGTPTETLEGLRLAPEAEFKDRLGQWLTAAYADALQFVDPATDDEVKIRDAFRHYVPTGQQDRMVSLFTGLFTAAGIMPERQKAAPVRKATAPIVIRAAQRLAQVRSRPAATGGGSAKPKPRLVVDTGLPPALEGLLQSLPDARGWTQDRRDKFVATFGAVLDFCFPIVAAELAETETADGQ